MLLRRCCAMWIGSALAMLARVHSAELLDVYLVPHSHCDAGWQITLDECVRASATSRIAARVSARRSRARVHAKVGDFHRPCTLSAHPPRNIHNSTRRTKAAAPHSHIASPAPDTAAALHTRRGIRVHVRSAATLAA